MNNLMEPLVSSALQVFEPETDVLYNLDETAHLVGASRRAILIYCRSGMVHPEVDEAYGAWYFDAAAIRVLRRIEYLRTVQGVNLAGIRMIMELLDRLEEAHQDVPLAQAV